ncbi:putative B3 domain-containing protein Os04g0347400 [Nymphaea colorata]|nr:putative B3 domain-containing protein Os04g0347400 [Nymphaea colorata]
MAIKSWPVELTNDSSGLVFKNGWEDFYKHHSLETGDFLIFRYNGNMHFSVRIYGRSYCEDSYILTDEHQGGMNHLDMPVHLPSLRPQGGDDEDDCVELCSTCRGSGIARASGKIVKKPDSKASVDRKKFLPGYPSFKIVLKREGEHVQRNVYVPTSFARKYMVGELEPKPTEKRPGRRAVKVTLCNQSDPSVEVCNARLVARTTKYKVEDYRISGGWPKFCKKSRLRCGDTCTFELTGERSGFNVYVHRGRR